MKRYIPFLFLMIFSLSLSVWGEELHRMGLIYEDPRDIPWLKEKKIIEVKIPLPDTVDHSSNMPPVGNQGFQASCVGWAIGYYYKTYQEWIEHGWSVTDSNHQFSPAFIYNHINGGNDGGAYFSDALLLLLNNGCASLADFPYSDADYTTWPTETVYDNAIPFRCENAYWIDCRYSIDLLKQHIAGGDIAVIGIFIWSNFDNIHNFDNVYCVADRYGTNRGGHAVVVVGYNDNKVTNDGVGTFRMVNSWGTSWGDQGYFWMSYEAVMNDTLSQEWAFYTTDKIGYSPVAKTRVRISHPARELVTIRIGIGPSGSPDWTKDFFDFYMSAGPDHPFPPNNIVFDISEGDFFLDSTVANNVFVRCTDPYGDGQTGTIDYFSCEQLDWGVNSFSYETPVNIPDNGTPAYANLSITGGTGIEEMRDIPAKFVLFAPRPNPSVGIVEMEYGLPERADIGLSIYDIQGRLVEVVYRGKRDAGYHKLRIDSRDLSSGIYFIRFQTPGSTYLKKLIILR